MEGIRTRHLAMAAEDRLWTEADAVDDTELVERGPASRAASAASLASAGALAADSLAGRRPSARRSMVLGGAALLVCIVSFVAQTVITRRVQESYVQPYFILWVSHSLWVVILPLHAAYERLKRRRRTLGELRLEALVGSAKLIVQRRQRAQQGAAYEAVQSGDDDGARALALSRPGWVVLRVAGLAALLAALLNASAYLWYVAVGFASMSKVTAIYNTSCFFAYLFSVLLLKERVQAVKCAAVGVSIVGVALMALGDAGADMALGDGGSDVARAAANRAELLGDALSLACACGIGLYQVLYKKHAVPAGFHSLFHVNFMTALLGACTLAVFWAPIPALHALGVERFRWPDAQQLALIAANAAFGVAYNAGFMIALALTSPLFAAIGVMLTIPAMAAVDMAVQGHALPWSALAGGAAILAGFAALTYAECRDSARKAEALSGGGDSDSLSDD